MLAVQDPGFLAAVIIMVTLAVIFWRIAVKLLAIGVIMLVILGLTELLRICTSAMPHKNRQQHGRMAFPRRDGPDSRYPSPIT